MSFLNPWGFLIIALVSWIFKNLFFTKAPQQKQTKIIFIVLILSLISLCRPVIKNEKTKESFLAKEYIIAIDVSFSMNLQDIKPSRYEVAKRNIISLLKINTKDIFSIFAFTTNPLLISPPSTDHNTAISALDALTPEYILTKGTSLISLIKQISKIENEQKSLIIFSDGGDKHNLNQLLSIASKHSITINVVAIGSKKGSILRKGNQIIKDKNSHLIISRVNPILAKLAKKTDGFYLFVDENHQNIAYNIQDAINQQKLNEKKLDAEVLSYIELYYIPLLFAFVLLLTSLTKFQKYIPFLVLIVFLYPNTKLSASIFDFYYNQVAKEAYATKNYPKAIENFQKLTPSKYSYICIANSYYKNKEYKNALHYYKQVKTKNKKIKSIIFYNMGNSASKLKKYNRAKQLYKNSLTLNYTKEAYENLLKIIKIDKKPKIDVSTMLPHLNDKEVKNITKRQGEQKDNKQNSSTTNSQQKTSKVTHGGNGVSKSTDRNNYRMGYNAYELINKGYVNEKKPW